MSWRETLNLGELFMGNKSVQAKTYDVVMTVGTEAVDAIDVAVQLNTPEGKALSEIGVVDFYLSTDAVGAIPATTVPTGGLAAGAAGKTIESIVSLSGNLISNAAGLVNVVITDVGTPTFYLVIVLPMGGLVISDAITFV